MNGKNRLFFSLITAVVFSVFMLKTRTRAVINSDEKDLVSADLHGHEKSLMKADESAVVKVEQSRVRQSSSLVYKPEFQPTNQDIRDYLVEKGFVKEDLSVEGLLNLTKLNIMG